MRIMFTSAHLGPTYLIIRNTAHKQNANLCRANASRLIKAGSKDIRYNAPKLISCPLFSVTVMFPKRLLRAAGDEYKV